MAARIKSEADKLAASLPAPVHQGADKPADVCWLLDVRRYGVLAANHLHP
jgi:hypothetical protein